MVDYKEFVDFYEDQITNSAFWEASQAIMAHAPSELKSFWGKVIDAMAEFEDEIKAWETPSKNDEDGWYRT